MVALAWSAPGAGVVKTARTGRENLGKLIQVAGYPEKSLSHVRMIGRSRCNFTEEARLLAHDEAAVIHLLAQSLDVTIAEQIPQRRLRSR